MSSLLQNYTSAFIKLFYPKTCIGCANSMIAAEETYCFACESKFPYTNFHKLQPNPLHKKFWGRIEFEHMDSLLFFERTSITQELLHHLKYNNRQDVGEKLAEKLLVRYKEDNVDIPFQAIVSIPIHPKKMKRRGYNQCDTFAQRLADNWQIPYHHKAIARTIDTMSQTGKSRIDRWENVSSIFQVVEPNVLEDKHILIIDDVLTTGATIEACALKIQEINGVKISVTTMACKL